MPLNVLLLEDSRFDAELLTEAMKAHYPDMALRWVGDEEGFVEALAEGACHVILSDYELPGFTGSQALEHALRLAPRTPFIFVSGVIGEDNAVELLKRGATDYVSKGRLSRLPLVIERALREAAQRQAIEEARGKLQEAGITFASVVDELRDYAVILLDPQGLIRSWNRAAKDIFGLRSEAAIGMPLAVLFTEEDVQAGVPARELSQAAQQGRAADDRWMRHADGGRLWAEGSLARLDGADGAHLGFCKILRDATESYEQSLALREAKEMAERANHAKDRFLAVLSHELRTPLSPIMSAAQLLERVAQVPDKYAGLLPMIKRNVMLEARLIEDLLDLTIISTGKLVLRKDSVDMHRLVHAVIDMVAEQARDKSLRLDADLCAEPALVLADEARMQQVLWNLVRNAVKFTPKEGRVLVRMRVEGERLRLECTDTGIGIDPVAMPRIFMAFEQADAEVSRSFGGLGLGLAIAKSLTAEHAGELSASSAGRGQGATFTLTLPVAKRTQAMADEQADPDPHADGDHRRLLLVEDNADAAQALMLSLESFGYDVHCAGSCAEALRLTSLARFDAVITDLGLPDGSGLQIGAALKGVLPVIALSGYGSPSDLKRSIDAGFVAHLIKPVDPSAVHAAVQQAMGSAS